MLSSPSSIRRTSRGGLIGRRVGGHLIVSHLASSGMSELYIARREGLEGFERTLVIKILQERYARYPRLARMFLDEARLAAGLNHSSIVHFYDVAEEDGYKYIAMEYIHGETLTDIIRRSIEEGAFLPLEHALHIVSQVADGLDYAHSRDALTRIVHGDISPSNIMVGYDGQTKIIDFGIARVHAQIRKEWGLYPGKASYMSPEQALGAPVDHRSDIFSLGIILYEITVARRLWRGPAEVVRRRIVSDAVPPPTSLRPDYPRALELIVMRALEKRPEGRYQSADEMRQNLEELSLASGFRGGARRLSTYLCELFPQSASRATDGLVAAAQWGGDSVPLPPVGGSSFSVGAATPALERTAEATVEPPVSPPAPARTRSSKPRPQAARAAQEAQDQKQPPPSELIADLIADALGRQRR